MKNQDNVTVTNYILDKIKVWADAEPANVYHVSDTEVTMYNIPNAIDIAITDSSIDEDSGSIDTRINWTITDSFGDAIEQDDEQFHGDNLDEIWDEASDYLTRAWESGMND